MANIILRNVKTRGIKTIIPEKYIDIDDELEFFENNPKKIARAKKMVGYGRRYIANENTTVVDLAVYAAEELFSEMNYNRQDIDLLIFVNQKPDYPEPCDACVAHGRLNLNKICTSIDINLGCSGYIHALMTAHTYLSTGMYKKCLILAGDLCGRSCTQSDRKSAPVFGDAASATILEYVENGNVAYFVTGTDGKGWNKIIRPFGGMRIPIDEKILTTKTQNSIGNEVPLIEPIIKGEDVFNFTMDIVPKLIDDIIEFAGLTSGDIDLFAIHQANKQIVENIVDKAQIPKDKAPTETFFKYANNSTNSVVTVLCDSLKDNNIKKVLLCAFGVGLSWGAAIIDIDGIYNGGISSYIEPKDKSSVKEQIDFWIKYIKGEE